MSGNRDVACPTVVTKHERILWLPWLSLAAPQGTAAHTLGITGLQSTLSFFLVILHIYLRFCILNHLTVQLVNYLLWPDTFKKLVLKKLQHFNSMLPTFHIAFQSTAQNWFSIMLSKTLSSSPPAAAACLNSQLYKL